MRSTNPQKGNSHSEGEPNEPWSDSEWDSDWLWMWAWSETQTDFKCEPHQIQSETQTDFNGEPDQP